MKIVDVRTQLFEYRLGRRRGDAHAPSGRTHQNNALVEILTDTDHVGIAIASTNAVYGIARLKRVLIGADPRQVLGLWQTMVDLIFKSGNSGIMNEALSALDMALWDLKGKAYGEPLWRLLGAKTNRVRAYASGGDMPLNDEQLTAFYSHMASRGFRAAKLKIGLDIEEDARRLALIRDVMTVNGKPPALMVDASEYWHAKQAVRRITWLEERFDLTWVEEPVQRADYRGLATVSSHIKAPVAAGENLKTVLDFQSYIEHGSADIVQVGRMMSGFTGAMQVGNLAYAHGLPCAGSDSEAKVFAHVAAALPNHMILEVHDDQVEEPMLRADNWIEDGHVVLGDSPGLGLTVDREILKAHSIEAPRPGRSGAGWAGRRAGAGLMEVPATDEERRIGALPTDGDE
ncbi:mandelate racemase/muconate lactonizing enzyme family protein [Devosia ginsengisoli]|uniref:mandelate racemase/muconate lactonizing enzyme family protein n=1 Tax=Devosia ginsengisoli TaxID=400770 RepID=UPI0026EA5156|nr:mandelate racemase/muconate lactonizing enzyme family protein [Devosia ginsengisoli]MCR6671341.1 mandelate racemase/muconate lactonizing enzyme family protein [Devosia ginsengisoli]